MVILRVIDNLLWPLQWFFTKKKDSLPQSKDRVQWWKIVLTAQQRKNPLWTQLLCKPQYLCMPTVWENSFSIFYKCHCLAWLALLARLTLSTTMAPLVQKLHFPHLHIPITIDHSFPVMPVGPIPASPSNTLYLSNLDDMIGARVFTPTVYFYRSNCFSPGQKPVTKTLHDALASVLVSYLPFLRQA